MSWGVGLRTNYICCQAAEDWQRLIKLSAGCKTRNRWLHVDSNLLISPGTGANVKFSWSSLQSLLIEETHLSMLPKVILSFPDIIDTCCKSVFSPSTSFMKTTSETFQLCFPPMWRVFWRRSCSVVRPAQVFYKHCLLASSRIHFSHTLLSSLNEECVYTVLRDRFCVLFACLACRVSPWNWCNIKVEETEETKKKIK